MAERLVVLLGVAEEGELDLPAVTCLCSNKAVKSNEELKGLISRKVWQVVEGGAGAGEHILRCDIEIGIAAPVLKNINHDAV